MELWLQIVSTVGTIIVAAVGGIFAVAQRKAETKIEKEYEANEEERERIEKRAAQRMKESLLTMRLMNADAKLTVGIAEAIKRGRVNGEIEEGLEAVKEAQEEYQKFNDELAAEHKNGGAQ